MISIAPLTRFEQRIADQESRAVCAHYLGAYEFHRMALVLTRAALAELATPPVRVFGAAITRVRAGLARVERLVRAGWPRPRGASRTLAVPDLILIRLGAPARGPDGLAFRRLFPFVEVLT